MTGRRVGLLGGAFNPPHQGHLRLAELALAHLQLDELRFVPTAVSPHKPDPGGPDGPSRRRLLDALLEGADPRFRIEPLELARGGTSYTVDTLERLAEQEPDSAWILVIGSDQLPGLAQWRRAERVFQLAAVAIAPRPGVSGERLEVPGLRPTERWSGRAGELVWLPSTGLELASTTLRSDLAADPGAAPEGLPSGVLSAIRSANLYGKSCSGACMTLDPRLAAVVEAARSKKAFRIRLLDVKDVASFTDTFAFMSGGSDRQNRAIADAVEEALRLTGERPLSSEGSSNGTWILLDYGSLVIHVMDEETRRHYNLEGLWREGRELELPPEDHPASELR